MKRCPDCRRDYYDDTLAFCLDDGALLLEGPASGFDPYSTLLSSPGNADPQTAVLPKPETGHINAIAVLPFANLSADSGNDYFCDGIAEELLNVLSKIRGLRVAARTSAFSFKGRSVTVAEIGRTLNVGSVLEGSIRIAGEHIRVSVQLVQVSDGYAIWSETYNRAMDDIFAVQDDIARSVVEELRSMLLGGDIGESASRQVRSEVEEAVRGRADDPEAQRLMFLGRYFLDKTTQADTTKAIGYFQEALDIDPEFAICWAELGRAYSIEAGRGWTSVEEGFARSREATERALKIEPGLAEGHAQLGRILLAHDRDIKGAEAAYAAAMRLAPGSSSVMDGASMMAYRMGRFDVALGLGRRVLVQDPLSAPFWHNLGLTCHAAGRLAESEHAFRRAIELMPNRVVSNALLALVLLDQERIQEAVERAELETEDFWRLWALAIIQFAAGDKEASDRALNELIDKHAYGDAYQIAEVFSARGDFDAAFEWLDKALGERDPGLTHAKVNPRFRPLHSDPRWPELLKQIGFG